MIKVASNFNSASNFNLASDTHALNEQSVDWNKALANARSRANGPQTVDAKDSSTDPATAEAVVREAKPDQNKVVKTIRDNEVMSASTTWKTAYSGFNFSNTIRITTQHQ